MKKKTVKNTLNNFEIENKIFWIIQYQKNKRILRQTNKINLIDAKSLQNKPISRKKFQKRNKKENEKINGEMILH